ncbi:unnamed protein product [Peniophora sp. CBMAI 1063]|nr:unnamed protein product [Peniophora sp. CBMAI 1063]
MQTLVLEDVPLAPGASRDAALPVLKRLAAGQVHPLRAHCYPSAGKELSSGVKDLSSRSTTFVYYFENDRDAAKKRHEASRAYRFKSPFVGGLLEAGFIQLRPGDAVFARPPGGSEDGMDDVLQVLILSDHNLSSAELGQDLREARDELLGPVCDMGADVPKDGRGGTAWERSGFANPVEKGARAYPILSTVQKGAGNTVGPGQFMKVSPANRDCDGVRMRSKALKAVVNASVAASKYLPLQYQRAFKQQADLVNAPRFVSDDNDHFSSVQVNLARPVPLETGMAFAISLYAYINQVTASAKGDPDVLTSKRYLSIGPDIMNNPEDKSLPAWITHPNFARDAWSIMTPTSLVTFFVRALYLMIVFAVRQLPAHLKIQVSTSEFLSAFSYEEDGERKTVGDWEFAPHINDPLRNTKRRSAAKEWNEFSEKVNSVIPLSVVRQDRRAQRIERGEVLPPIFNIHEEEPENSEQDGAERPEANNYTLVRYFGTSKTGTSGEINGRGSSPEEPSPATPVSQPEKLQLLSDPRVSRAALSKAYLDWVSQFGVAFCTQANTDILDRLSGAHTTPLITLSFDTSAATVLHPWWNPLNGPMQDWSAPSSPCLRLNDVPENGRAILSPQAVESDFIDVFLQTNPGQATRRPKKSWSLEKSVDASAFFDPSQTLKTSLDGLSAAWTDLQIMRSGLSASGIAMRSSAVALMAMEAIVWAKLESLAALFSQKQMIGSEGCSGLGVISAHLWDMVDSRVTTREIDIAPLLSASTAHHVILEVPAARTARSDFERQRQVYAGLLGFLGDFLGVQDPRDARLRAWLVWLVVDVWGFDALYHVCVWNAWRFPQTRCIVGRLATKQPSLDDMLPLVGLISKAKSSPDHPLSALATLSLEASVFDNKARVMHVAKMFDSIMGKAYRWKTSSNDSVWDPPDGEAILRSLYLSGLLVGLPFDERARSDVEGIKSLVWKGRRQNLESADKEFLLAASQNQDMYLPFKELQPSAQCMRSLFSGQEKDVMLTDLGFKNAVVTRFLSYNAPFLLSGKQSFFTSLEDLLRSVESEAGRGEEYFVSGRIYGRNLYRHPKNAQAVWDSCTFPSSAGRSFKRFWALLHEGVGPQHEFKVRFVGPLLALHIAGKSFNYESRARHSNALYLSGDYFAAGHLEEPSFDDMAEIIRTVNSGGVKGLRAMGFIPNDIPDPGKSSKYDLRVVQRAFSDYYKWVSMSVDPVDLQSWKWNVVTGENHLCKHTRLLGVIKPLAGPMT